MKAVVIVSIAILVSLGGQAETRPDFEDALRKANSLENAHLPESVNSGVATRSDYGSTR